MTSDELKISLILLGFTPVIKLADDYYIWQLEKNNYQVEKDKGTGKYNIYNWDVFSYVLHEIGDELNILVKARELI